MTGRIGSMLVLCYLCLFWGGCLHCRNFNFRGLVSLLLPFGIGFGIVGTHEWWVVRGFVTWGCVLLVWNLGNFNSAVCDALVECVSTCIVVMVRLLLYRLMCGVGCCGLLFYYLGACVPKFMSVGLPFMGWFLLRLRRFSGLGLVCIWAFRWNVGFCGPWITFVLIVLVGRWFQIVIGVWHNFSFFELAYAAWRVWDRRRTRSSF